MIVIIKFNAPIKGVSPFSLSKILKGTWILNELIILCKKVVISLVEGNYSYLGQEDALSRVSEEDIRSVLENYGGVLSILPDEAFKINAFEVYKYDDNSGYKIDLDLWINNTRSDLTLQLDVKTDNHNKILSYRILDILVM